MQRILPWYWNMARKGPDGTVSGAFYPLLGLNSGFQRPVLPPNSSCDRGDMPSPRPAQLPSRRVYWLAQPGHHV